MVGCGNIGGADNIWHAFLYSGSTMTDLGTLGGTHSYAYGINDNGDVVGTYTITGYYYWADHAFLYSNGQMNDLRGLIQVTSGWTLTGARAINNRGQIVGYGTNPAGLAHAFLLTPVFTTLSQNDPLWKDIPYAGTSDKIGGLHSKGCALTSLAMALTGAGISEDPGTLNSLMLANGGYNAGGNVDWGTAVKTAARAASAPDVKFHGDVRSSKTSDLDHLLSLGHPVIVGVNPSVNSQGQTVWGHFVVVTGKQGSTYTIADPGYSNRPTLASYNNVFETRGYVSDPPDVSEIDISVVAPGSGVNLLLTDSHGNKTGIDGSGGRFELIPGSVHFIDAIVGVDSDQPATEVSQYIQVQLPQSGDYGIEIRGIDASPTSYSLRETAFAPDGSQLWSNEIIGVVAPGSVDQYSIRYTVPEPAMLGDFNGDGSVDIADYTTWADHYGQDKAVALAAGSFITPGTVGIDDYTTWADHFGSIAAITVAQPASPEVVVQQGRCRAHRGDADARSSDQGRRRRGKAGCTRRTHDRNLRQANCCT